jgi:hypothetical protein
MEKEVIECTHFRAGPLPALKQALKELGVEGVEMEMMKNGEVLLPDGRRIVCETFFDEANFDNLCVQCVVED